MGDFKPPPIELPLEYVFDFHAVENPHHIAISHPCNNGNGLKTYTYCDLGAAIHRAGESLVSDLGLVHLVAPSVGVVAIILKTDAMTYLTVMAGLMRAGFIPLPISDRCPANVIAHILSESPPAGVIINGSTSSLATNALQEYTSKEHSEFRLCILRPDSFSSWYLGNNDYTPLPSHQRKADDISIIMHSSSSTSVFPKKLAWSSRILTQRGEIPDMPLQDVTGKVFGCFGMDFFHGYGISIFSAMARRGLILSLMDPTDPTSILPGNPIEMYKSFKSTKPSMLFVEPPRVLEDWAEDQDKVTELAVSGVDIYYAGRPLNKAIGDRLVRSGVKICTVYGTTECGGMVIFPKFNGEDWEFWSVYPRPDVNFVEKGSSGLYELFVAPSMDNNYLACINAIWDGKAAYNPGDLFTAHPSRPHVYKVYGRMDDQILLSTGEMVNPIPTEDELSRLSIIHSATMFGHMRPQVGIIIETVSEIEDKTPSRIVDEIWPVLEKINAQCASHYCISRQMVLMAKSEKPISINHKGMPRRRLVWAQYQDEIEALYK